MKPRNLLAIALTTALLSPVAMAEKGGVQVTGNATAQATQTLPTQANPQAATDLPRPTLPPQASQKATDAVTQKNKNVTTTTPPTTTTTDTTTTAATDTDTDEAPMTTPKAPPTQSQGAAHAAAHSAVVQRDVWAKLDTDGDGQISVAEGDVDADFKTSFATMDSNGDGFISSTEYRAGAKEVGGGNTATGSTDAAQHSTASVRSLWSRLDVNGDGQISTTEGEVNTGFKTDFSVMDSNSDGFVTQAEYRAHIKASRK